MKEIFYNNVHFIENNYIIFEINALFEFIVGTNDYKINITNDYFNSFIKKGICTIEEYKKYNFNIIECDARKFGINNINKFPTLYISNIAIHHIFELIGKELFIKYNNKWYFQIVFPIEDLDPIRWIIGKIFLRKYPVIFSPYNRLIGFYLRPNKGIINKNQTNEGEKILEKIKNHNSFFSKDMLWYIKIIVVALNFMGLGLFIGKKIFFTRKKRANELDDDFYEYNSEKKNKKDINKEKEQFTSIEMNSKLGIK